MNEDNLTIIEVKVYLVLKNLILPRVARFSMGHACPALRESEFFGFA